MPQSEMQKVAFFKQNEINNIVIQILRSRMDKLKSENPQLVMANVTQVKPIDNYSIKANQTAAMLLTSAADWREILKKALVEVEKMKRIGVSDEELSNYISYKDSSDFRAVEDTTAIEWNDYSLYSVSSDAVDAKGAAENCIEHYLKGTIALSPNSVVFSEDFRHSKFVAYRVKDAIADYFREKTEKRPNVSISNPDIRINVHIAENDVTISLDSSGESLHKRGYRTGSGAAPLNAPCIRTC